MRPGDLILPPGESDNRPTARFQVTQTKQRDGEVATSKVDIFHV